MTRRVRGLQQLRVLQAAARRRLPLVLPDVTLMILVGATWMGLYLAKRITRPCSCWRRRRARSAPAISTIASSRETAATSSGRWSRRSTAWPASWRQAAGARALGGRPRAQARRSRRPAPLRRDDSRAHRHRRRLGRRRGQHRHREPAAARLLGLEPRRCRPARATDVFGAADLQPLATCSQSARRAARRAAGAGSRAHARRPRAAPGGRGDARCRRRRRLDGMVLVFDDVTPLIRAQKVAAWREVARRLAHEIKNPLTPIQLSRRTPAAAFQRGAAADAGAGRGMHVDDRRRSGLAEGAGRRVLAVRAHAGAARGADGPARAARRRAGALRRTVRRRRDSSAASPSDLPKVRVDPEQIRRVIINLVDNAIEAMERRGAIDDRDQHDRGATALVRIDRGRRRPGHSGRRSATSCSCRTTRPSGAAAASASRSCGASSPSTAAASTSSDNVPRGTRFTIELPC